MRVGVYHVLGPLGTGGMGEVYRARDTKLQRDVALKSLPDNFLTDAKRRARFEREARTLAALNHPHIAQVFGLEDLIADAGTIRQPILVMELVEGEDLSVRIARGRLPLRDGLRIARQIALALEAAHEAGIIHRDLKPSNVRVRPDGVVKVLDFGLARGGHPLDADLTDTITSAGAIVGSAAYMSPEQARGLAVDRRTDIWSFGCVLFELLSGRRAFDGGSRSDTLAAVLNAAPDFGALPATIPAAVRRLLRRCLAKDPDERLHDVADARLELDDPDQPPASVTTGTPSTARRLAILGFFVLGAAAGGLGWHALRPSQQARPPVVRFVLTAGDSMRFDRRAGLAVSPDGEHVAYATAQGFVLRSRSRLATTLLQDVGTFPGTPFFSPDGEWLAYADSPVLKKMSIRGGAPTLIGEVGWGASGDWSAEGIVLADVRGLFRVTPEGGPAEPIGIELDAAEQVTAPEILPGGRAVLYTVIPTRSIVVPGVANVAGARIEAIDLQTRARKVLIRGGSDARYASTGHLLYLSEGSVHAVGFDVGKLELSGQPAEVVSGSIVEFAISAEGTLAYAPANRTEANTLVWVDRQGREQPLGAPPHPYLYPRISPDGTRIALDVMTSPDRDIWIWDLRRRALDRFTVDSAGNPLVAWTRDGRHLAFGSDRFGHTNLFMQAADGSGRSEHLVASDRIQMPLSFTPDGRLLFSEEVPGQGRNIHVLALDGRGEVGVVIATPAHELNAEVSPDGKWLAYDSNESGQFEVYVRPYPNVAEARWKISLRGGRQPLWSRDGHELFYRDFSGAVMGVSVSDVSGFRAGEAMKIIDGGAYTGGGPFGSARTYDVSLDGRRLLMIKRGESNDDAGTIVVVVNWFEELKRLVPIGPGP
jgi:eukaryotic-like serine/threonine-protein kinase